MAQIYFGNIRKAGFVAAPTTGMSASGSGRSEVLELANGGAFASLSAAQHRTYDMSWGASLDTDLAFLSEYRSGLYGTGLLYFVDPFAADVNALPPHWASPMLSGNGWPSLVSPGVVPTITDTAANSYNQPYQSATYLMPTTVGAVPSRVLTLLIPPTHTLHLGFSGTATNGGVIRVQPININGTLAPVQDMTLLSAAASTRINKTLSGATYKAVQIYFTSTTTTQGTVTLTSGKAVYAVTGASVTTTGNHSAGKGHTGLRMADPTLVYVQSRTNKKYVSGAVTLTEIGAWI